MDKTCPEQLQVGSSGVEVDLMPADSLKYLEFAGRDALLKDAHVLDIRRGDLLKVTYCSDVPSESKGDQPGDDQKSGDQRAEKDMSVFSSQ